MPRVLNFILTEDFADWEYAPLAGAGRGYYEIKTRFFSPDGKPVTSMGGLEAKVDGDYEAAFEDEKAVIAVIGGMRWEADKAPKIEKQLNKAHERGQTIAGICGGTRPLARAGLLNDVRHTSNDPETLTSEAGYSGAEHYVETNKAVADRGIITAAGNAPASFAAEVLRIAGVAEKDVQQLLAMMAVEHHA